MKPVNYTASTTPATITIEDNDIAGVSTVVTISGPASGKVFEGHSADFTITATPAPAGTDVVVVNYRITEVGTFLGTVANTSRTGTINIDVNDQNGAEVLPLPTIQDAVDEADGSLTVQILAYTSGGTVQYNVGSGNDFSATTELIDDDITGDSIPKISIAAESTPISESIHPPVATFRLTATSTTPASNASVFVNIMVVEDPEGGEFIQRVESPPGSGNFIIDPAQINRRVSVPIGSSGTFDVPISGDTTDEKDGKITVILLPDTTNSPPEYAVVTPFMDDVVVEDDDETFSITEIGSEAEGNVEADDKKLNFVVTLSGTITSPAQVTYTVGKRGDDGSGK